MWKKGSKIVVISVSFHLDPSCSKEYDIYHYQRYRGQYIFVVPEQNMVVVFVSGFPGIELETVPNDLLKTFILPAAISIAALPANPEQVALLGRYRLPVTTLPLPPARVLAQACSEPAKARLFSIVSWFQRRVKAAVPNLGEFEIFIVTWLRMSAIGLPRQVAVGPVRLQSLHTQFPSKGISLIENDIIFLLVLLLRDTVRQ